MMTLGAVMFGLAVALVAAVKGYFHHPSWGKLAEELDDKER